MVLAGIVMFSGLTLKLHALVPPNPCFALVFQIQIAQFRSTQIFKLLKVFFALVLIPSLTICCQRRQCEPHARLATGV